MTASDPVVEPARPRRHRALVGFAWTGLAILLLVALALAALTWGPNLMRERLAQRVGGQLGREVAIERIEVAPLSGRFVVDGLRIGSTEPGEPMLAIRRVAAEIDPWPYLRGLLVVRAVTLDAPALRIVRIGPDRFDFSDVLERFAGRPASERRTVWRVDRIAIADGSTVLEDRVVRKTSRIEALRLDVTHLSNHDGATETPTSLATAFTLDGRPARIEGSATPFAASPRAEVHATLDALPIASLLPYVPLPADVRPAAGALGLDLKARWERDAAPTARVEASGSVTLDGLSVKDAAGRERIAARHVAVELAPSRPLGGTLHVARIAVQAPRATLARTVEGRLDWPATAGAATGTAASPASAASTKASAAAPSNAAPPSAAGASPPVRPHSLKVDVVAVDGGRVDWRDSTLHAPLELRIDPVTLALRGVAIADLSAPTRITGQGRLDATVDGTASIGADLRLEGSQGSTTVSVGGIDLARYAPLAGPAITAGVETGRIDAKATLGWEIAGATGPSWSITDGSLDLTGLKLVKGNREPALLERLRVAGVSMDPAARRVEIESVGLSDGYLRARTRRDGSLDLADWYTPGGEARAPRRSASASDAASPAASSTVPERSTGSPPKTEAPSPASAPWSARIARAEIERFRLDYHDRRIGRDRKPPSFVLNGRATDLTLDPSKPIAFEASASLDDGSGLSARGTVRPKPLDVDAQLRVTQLSVPQFDPYLAPFVNVLLASGRLWSAGRLQVQAGPDGALDRIAFQGEFSANEFRAIDQASSEDFVRWSALAVPSVRADWRMGRPGDSTIELGDVAFVDFYTRLILSPEGRLNVSNVLRTPGSDEAARSLTRAPAAPQPAGGSPRPPPADDRAGQLEASVTYGTGVGGPAAPGNRRTATIGREDRGPMPTVRVGTVRIAGGNVNFTDLFIRPNYTANLTQLNGSIEAIASDRPAPSDVLITGRVDGDTPLEITGKINPLAPRSFVDLRAVARGFELPKLSPYSGRWAGYAIRKGRLTADVRYQIIGDELKAENRLTINQLTFGDKVDSPDATSLPVRFAVSLLKDRNGNIDLDLPISGTISDPQFSVGSLLWRAIGNVIAKVAASPFNFLASLAGGGSIDGTELSRIEFAPGASILDDEDRARLDALARALVARPELTLEIRGVADPGTDREALQRERLEQQLKAAKLGRMRRANRTAQLPSIDQVTVDPGERTALLEQAWRDAKLDAQGAPLPEPERIEQQLIEASPIANEEIAQVAQRRAQAAHDYLREAGGIADERIYLIAPRVAAADDAKPPRRVEFTVE